LQIPLCFQVLALFPNRRVPSGSRPILSVWTWNWVKRSCTNWTQFPSTSTTFAQPRGWSFDIMTHNLFNFWHLPTVH
jgi:hypothetical protein